MSLICFLPLAAAIGCSNGQGNQVVGVQCGDDPYVPIPMDMNVPNKMYSVNYANQNMAPGTYVEVSTLFYFTSSPDPSKPKNLRVMASDFRQPDGTYAQGLNCVRNAKAGLAGTTVKVQAVSQVVVDYNLGMQATAKNYGFHVRSDGVIVSDAAAVNQPAFTSLTGIYSGATSAFVYRLDDFNYQVRSSGNYTDAQGNALGTYTLVVQLARVPGT